MIEDDDRDLDGRYRDRLRSTLQTMVREEPSKRRHMIRSVTILAAGALAAAASIAIAIPIADDRPDAALQVVCLDSADPIAVDDATAAQTVSLAQAAEATPQDAEAACRALWADGTLNRTSVRFQSGSRSSPASDAGELELVVCALPDGRPGVIPGTGSTCAMLGMKRWRHEP